MASLAEQVIVFRAAGVGAVQTAIGGVARGLASIGSAARSGIASVARLGSTLSQAVSPANILAGVGMGIGQGLVSSMAGAAKSAIALAANTETLQTSFRVLLGSGDAAARMLDQINQFAAQTPFEQMEIAEAAKQLLAAGISADEALGSLKRLGDMAALSGASLGEMAAIYAKITSQGRLTAETLESFQTRGIPIAKALADVFGVAENQVRELVSEGQVGLPEVQAAIASLTDAGGQFAGGMEQLAQTTGGLWSTVTGNLKMAAAQMGGMLIETLHVREGLSWLGQALAQVPAMLRFVIDQWALLWQIALERLRLFIRNSIERAKAFFQNVGIGLDWLLNNWRDVFTTIADATKTIVTNMFDNLKNLWKAFTNWIATGEWNFNWTPVMQGFKSSLKEMPQFVEAQVQESSEKLDELNAKLAEAWAAMQGTKTPEKAPGTTPASALANAAKAATEAPAAAQAARGAGGGARFVGFAELARQMQEDALKRQEESARKTADATQRLARAAKGDALRVELAGPVPAVLS
jgi:tape measure domain-containing protein